MGSGVSDSSSVFMLGVRERVNVSGSFTSSFLCNGGVTSPRVPEFFNKSDSMKVVMVKKPNGDGTHKKKGRVVHMVCGNFQMVQPGEETCANPPSFPMLRTLISLASFCMDGQWNRGNVSTAFLYAPLIEKRDVYCRPPQVLA